MTKERVRVLNVLAALAYEARLDDEASAHQRLHDEIEEEAAAALSTVDAHSPADEGSQRRSRRDRHKREATGGARPDYAVVREDIDRIRRALASQNAIAATLAAPMPSPAAPSPVLKPLSPVMGSSPVMSGAETFTVLVTPDSPTHSLVPPSPASSRSVSPEHAPRSRPLTPTSPPHPSPTSHPKPPSSTTAPPPCWQPSHPLRPLR